MFKLIHEINVICEHIKEKVLKKYYDLKIKYVTHINKYKKNMTIVYFKYV